MKIGIARTTNAGPAKSQRSWRKGRAHVLLSSLIAGSLLLAACSSDEDPPERKSASELKPVSREDAQDLLDAATKHLRKSGTGDYTIETVGLGSHIEGKFDLDKPFVSQSMTMPAPDEPKGYTINTIGYKGEAFVGFSDGPLRKCWLRYEPDDMAEAVGAEGANPADFMSDTPHAVELLMKPVAQGFVKGSTSRIKADVNLAAALSTALPKATVTFAHKLDEDATVPITLDLSDGHYSGASYTIGAIFKAAKIDAADIRKTGLLGSGMKPKRALSFLSSVAVEIAYGSYGQAVEYERPSKASVIDVDLATMGDDTTCEAANR